MIKAKLTRADGTVLELEGTSDEVAAVLAWEAKPQQGPDFSWPATPATPTGPVYPGIRYPWYTLSSRSVISSAPTPQPLAELPDWAKVPQIVLGKPSKKCACFAHSDDCDPLNCLCFRHADDCNKLNCSCFQHTCDQKHTP